MIKIITTLLTVTLLIASEVTIIDLKPSKNNSNTNNSRILGKIISSGEIEIEEGKTNIYTAITNSEGVMSITNTNPFCRISIRNSKGKIIAVKSLLNLNPQIKVKANEVYYIYAKTNNPKQCKSFEIFIP